MVRGLAAECMGLEVRRRGGGPQCDTLVATEDTEEVVVGVIVCTSSHCAVVHPDVGARDTEVKNSRWWHEIS